MVEVKITSNLEFSGLTSTQLERLKEALTYDNPAYANALRYSRYNNVKVPKYLYYYEMQSRTDENGKKHSVLVTPVGFDFEPILNADYTLEDLREENRVEYPPFKLQLRDTQQQARDVYMGEVQNKTLARSMLQLPTGKGKSILALSLARELGVRTLVLVHKDDLVTGWTKDAKLCFGDNFKVGLIKAKKRVIGDQVTIATVQTLSRMSEEELSKYLDQFGLVVQDECHHVGLKIFNIIGKFNSKYKIGLSATPMRSDGLDFVFQLFFGGLAFKYEHNDNDKDICPVKVIGRDSHFKYKPFMYQGMIYNVYDYKPEELPKNITYVEDMDYKDRPTIPFLTIDNEVVTSRQHKIMVCKDIIENYRKGRSCIALFTQKEHIRIYQRYLSNFIPKETILLYYGDNKEDSSTLMEKAESKQCLVTLATYSKATEGTNVKAWEVEFLVSSTNNAKNTEQAVGRVRRTCEGKINPVLVYDYRSPDVYSLSKHQYTRNKVYKKLKFTFDGKLEKEKPKKTSDRRSIFSRGY